MKRVLIAAVRIIGAGALCVGLMLVGGAADSDLPLGQILQWMAMGFGLTLVGGLGLVALDLEN